MRKVGIRPIEIQPGRLRPRMPSALPSPRVVVERLVPGALAGLASGWVASRLPFYPPGWPLGLAGSARPGAVVQALWAQLSDHPELVGEALVLAAAAVLLPYARNRGPWPAALFGAGLLAATALTAPGAAVLPLVAAAWLISGTLALQTKT